MKHCTLNLPMSWRLLSTVEVLTPIKQWAYTITADNGNEFADHKTISQSLALDFYFAKPYYSRKRGANEN